MARYKLLANLPRVHIASYRTMFWRYQTGLSDQFLATIEAIYYFFVEWHRAQHGAGASDAPRL